MKCCIFVFYMSWNKKKKANNKYIYWNGAFSFRRNMHTRLVYSLEILHFLMYLCSDEATLSQVISNVSTQELVCRLTYLYLIS